jgi:hypothetical protein
MSIKPSIPATALAISLGLLFVQPFVAARAGTVLFDDLTPNFDPRVVLPDVDDLMGRITRKDVVNEASIPEVASVFFSAPSNSPGHTLIGAATGPGFANFTCNLITSVFACTSSSNILESSSSPVTSDKLVFEFSVRSSSGGDLVGDAHAFFFSRSDPGGLDPLPNSSSLVENGNVQAAASITWLFSDDTNVVDTIQFGSDVETVPEPASLFLLGAGLVGLNLFARRGARRNQLRGSASRSGDSNRVLRGSMIGSAIAGPMRHGQDLDVPFQGSKTLPPPNFHPTMDGSGPAFVSRNPSETYRSLRPSPSAPEGELSV